MVCVCACVHLLVFVCVMEANGKDMPSHILKHSCVRLTDGSQGAETSIGPVSDANYLIHPNLISQFIHSSLVTYTPEAVIYFLSFAI